ncbi:toll/interleukin-1 receptor domain-containing protein [Rhizobium leguminosarum]|uniref:toll/interleukin-1 receptor domain-containing protein n=1 Tax=Rhizobium leguminosarum TaxID=384 RepID=UPI0010409B59|nr:toll/interleukin-1 receptor domain-containing protein [Rhizobium leguminosarum]TBZ85561.1 TIR domain-containing protein [Rhizobium leguminosarum bv. viciae]
MVEFITSDELRSYAAKRSEAEQARMRMAARSRSPQGATFLSHSSKDKDLVVGAIIVLENHGAQVYIDEVDPEMPPYTNTDTANLLKSRIRQSRKFVLLTSKNSKESRWVPWELGVADGYKDLPNIALFPSSDTAYDMSWADWEYLGLYHRIVWGKHQNYEKEIWMVLDQRTFTATELSAWLRR